MKPQWEKEFDKEFKYKMGDWAKKDVKSFIKSQRQQAVKEVLGKIRLEKREFNLPEDKDIYPVMIINTALPEKEIKGYNQAIDDLETLKQDILKDTNLLR